MLSSVFRRRAAACFLFAASAGLHAQSSLLAYWTFNNTTGGSPAGYSTTAASYGEAYNAALLRISCNTSKSAVFAASAYADVSNLAGAMGSGWGSFAGATLNALPPDVAGGTLTVVGTANNGRAITFVLSGAGYRDFAVSYDSRNTASGYNGLQWSWSTDGMTFTNLGSSPMLSTTFATFSQDFGAATALNEAPAVYLRLTLSGATSASGNFRLDNVQIRANPTGTGSNPLAVSALALPSAVPDDGTGVVTLAATVTPGTNPASTGLGVTADLTALGGGASVTLLDDGLGADALASDNVFTTTFNVGAGTALGVKNIPVAATDAQARNAAASTSVEVLAPYSTVAIGTIQGSGDTTPFFNTAVVTTGVVTGARSNGYFLQSPAPGDGDAATSDGIFVFTGVTPTVLRGDLIDLFARATEFPGAAQNDLRVTELDNVTRTVLRSRNHPLPAPVAIAAAETSAPNAFGLSRLERLEGMRVTAASFTVVSPTDGSLTEPTATATSNGNLQVVVTGVDRPLREPGVELPAPAGIVFPANTPFFDANPERLGLDTDDQPGALALNLPAGTTLTGVTGPLHFFTKTATILLDPGASVGTANVPVAQPVPAPRATDFTVVSANLLHFYDDVPGPSGAPTLTPAAYAGRQQKALRLFRDVLRLPDIIAVQEMESLAVLSALGALLNANSAPNPGYTAYLSTGTDLINVGFLVKAGVTVNSVTQIGASDLLLDAAGAPIPGDNLHDRPPLVLEATGPSGFALTVIAVHNRSLIGIESTAAGTNGYATEGDRVRAKRLQQAIWIANYLRSRQLAAPAERVLVVGDYNAFPFNDGYVDAIGTIAGTPAPADAALLSPATVAPFVGAYTPPSPAFHILPKDAALVPPAQQYSYVFGGNAQELDSALGSATLRPLISRLSYGRANADYPNVLFADFTRPERLADHDPIHLAIDTRPYALWKATEFGLAALDPLIGGDQASPSGDGVANLVKYALGLDPFTPATSGQLPAIAEEGGFLTLTATRSAAATDVQFVVEAAGDLAAGPWSSAGLVTLVDTPTQLKVRDVVPIGAAAKRFLRLRIVWP